MGVLSLPHLCHPAPSRAALLPSLLLCLRPTVRSEFFAGESQLPREGFSGDKGWEGNIKAHR